MAEVTEVSADGVATRTIAIEAEDPDRVIATVREFGFASPPNVCYPQRPQGAPRLRGAARARSSTSARTRSSSTSREPGADGAWRTIVDRAEVTRLGEGLEETGELNPEPMERTVSAIAGMADEATQNGVAAVAAVGTAGLRIARNSAAFVAAVQERCGVAIEVIPGEEEGRLAYLAVRSGLGLAQGSLVVFDTGGGSSQFTFGHGEQVDERFSVDVGAVRYTEHYQLAGVVSQEVLRGALDAIATDLVASRRPAPARHARRHGRRRDQPDSGQARPRDLRPGHRPGHGARPRRDRPADRAVRRSPVEERRTIVGLQPKRAEVILAGACIVRTVMDKLGKESLTVSDRGLRHGLLVERFGTPAEAR